MSINRPVVFVLFFIATIISMLFGGPDSYADSSMTGKKVLVVMSYHKTSNSELKIREGIESVLQEVELKYFYMDTKNHPENGAAQAKEAFALYQQFHPDAVITADDNAQSLFVLPYLKGKVTTPIVFCGVNDEVGKYGYPTKQITGILEKKHYREGITFARLIAPWIKKVGVLYKDNPSNKTNVGQIKKEAVLYPVTITDFKEVKTTKELGEAIISLEKQADALLVLNLAGVIDESGVELTGNEGVRWVAQRSTKATIGSSKREIVSGLLCGVAKLNREQGEVAARMVQAIIAGKAVGDIPVTWNRNGQRVINVTTARKLALPLKPVALIGTALVQ